MADIPPPPPGFTIDSPQGVPPPPPGFTVDQSFLDIVGDKVHQQMDHSPAAAVGENLLNLGSGAIAAPIAGIAGILSGGDADVVRGVQGALTYEPRTRGGKALNRAISYVPQKIAEGSDAAGQKVSELTGSPALGAATNVALQSAPALALHKAPGIAAGLRGGAAAEAGVADSAEAAARAYVTDTLGLDWNRLAGDFKARLTDIAKDATALGKLNPQAVARQARLNSLGIPATRGQINRDLGQITTEENLTKTKAGQPIRDINAAQDERLHGLIDDLRGQTGAQAKTRQGVGQSVQGAQRAKVRALKSDYKEAYARAEEAGSTREPVSALSLQEWLKDPGNARNAPWLRSALRDYARKNAEAKGEISINSSPEEVERYLDEKEKSGKLEVTINDLEKIRKEGSAKSKSVDGTVRHYAGEAVKQIDQILDNSGGDLFREARSKFKAYKDEFDRQGRIKKLVTEKGYSTDRAVALEDTLDHILRSSTEDIGKIRKSLTKGGTAETRAQGVQAWRDIQGGVLEYLREKATGRRQIPGETGKAQFNSSFLDAFRELEADGKIDVLFDKRVATKLRDIAKAVEDVRTKPSGRISGSDTVPRALNMVERLLDTKLGGAVGIVKKVAEIGKDDREARASVKDPLKASADDVVAKQRKRNNLKSLGRSARSSAPLTIEINKGSEAYDDQGNPK